MFTMFERLLKPTENPERPEPPAGLIAFFWHYAQQAKGLFIALFAIGFVVALLDTMIPIFIGRVVTLITSSKPDTLFADFWPLLVAMALTLLVLRPLAITTQNLLSNQAISANVSNRIRWQNHWHVVRQSWAFFQNDFAGRIANRVMQTGPAIRETVVALITGVWYILVYGTSALILLASADPWLALPVVVWFVGYLVLLRVLVPRMRDRSKEVSEARSLLTGRIVDSYTNILTVKLFARAREEDAYVRDAVDSHTGLFYQSLRLNTLFSLCLSSLNAMLVTGTGGIAIYLWTRGMVDVGTVAMALPLAWQIVSIAGWVAYQITTIFENIGVVQEGMMTIARPIALTDQPDAAPLEVTHGEIRFEDLRFGYGREAALASEASGQRGNSKEVRAPDTRPEPGSSARAALASEASGQRGNSKEVRAHSASKDARERADDTRPEPGSSAHASAREDGRLRPNAIIEGLTLTVRPGEKIGLIGRSGAGKSTLVNLLLRFFDLEGGRIVIDGQDIATVTQESLRSQISMVTQDTSLLHRSIRDNIRYGRPEATEMEIREAARLAHAEEFIAELEDWRGRRGYDAHVGERGVKLSGGQRQRIAIARVILKDAPILVLDEATSALDSEVEAAIQSSLGTLMTGKSVIAIAHRLSTIARMDRLIVLDHGRIVEQGTHQELLALGGHYAALWRRQSGGFIDAGDMQAAE